MVNAFLLQVNWTLGCDLIFISWLKPLKPVRKKDDGQPLFKFVNFKVL